jgi:hypothetical protein
MNTLTMNTPKVTYALEIQQLTRPFRSTDNLQNGTRLHTYESTEPLGAFNVGDTFSHGQPLKYLGKIQHIHHSLSSADWSGLVHRTILYVFDGA